MTVDPRLRLTPGEYLIHPDGSASKVVDGRNNHRNQPIQGGRMSELADIEYFKELCAQSVLPSEYAAVRKEFAEMIQKVILAAKREAFEEAIEACAEQGTIQEPDNPYLEAE